MAHRLVDGAAPRLPLMTRHAVRAEDCREQLVGETRRLMHGRARICGAPAMHMRCTCDAHAMHMRCTCDAHAVHMRCTGEQLIREVAACASDEDEETSGAEKTVNSCRWMAIRWSWSTSSLGPSSSSAGSSSRSCVRKAAASDATRWSRGPPPLHSPRCSFTCSVIGSGLRCHGATRETLALY